MVTISILNAVNKFSFSNFIDIGGAEGYTAHLIRTLFQVPVKSTDLSTNACKMAREIFAIDAIPADIHHLPFKTQEFDVVLCSETIEHVTDYKRAVDELLRITKNVLIITVPHETPEIVAQNISNKVPHGHIHYFDVNTLNYLQELGYDVTYEKTLSPLLVFPRVLIEGMKKNKSGILYKIYNILTPAFRFLFGLRSANFIVDMDKLFVKLFGAYGGITFTVIKQQPLKIRRKKIKARDFTSITVKAHSLPFN